MCRGRYASPRSNVNPGTGPSEIMVKHAGDEAKGYGRTTYVCSCGTPMQLEHAAGQFVKSP